MFARIVVLKFGGTSVASPQSREKIIDKVRAALRRGDSPVVVVSAMGRAPAPYATDTLLGLVSDQQEVHDRAELDQLMSCGEIISCVVLSHALREAGIAGRMFDGRQAGVRTTGAHGDAKIIGVDTQRLLATIAVGGVPVVAGFQGVEVGGDITTLGRGGSDTSAVALGAALRAHYVEIYTDVDGVMTADPRVFDGGQLLAQINFEEMGELASEGAKVVHPRAVEMADEHGVPVWVRNTHNDLPGTYMARAVPRQAYEREQVISGIAHVFGLSRLVIKVSDRSLQVKILDRLAEEGVNLDLITVAPTHLVVILVTTAYEAQGKSVLQELDLNYEMTSGCGKISLVGAGMRGTPGVMAKVLHCLHEADVSVLHSTDSNITISLLVAEADVAKAVKALHHQFFVPVGSAFKP